MKRKVKKYAGGNLVDSSGNPVRSGSGEPVRTRSDDEIAEDSKFGGYGRYMPKTKSYSMDDVKSGISKLVRGKEAPKPSEDLAPYEPESPFLNRGTGTDITNKTESVKPIIDASRAPAADDSDTYAPKTRSFSTTGPEKKKAVKKAPAKPASQEFPTRDRDRADQSFPLKTDDKKVPPLRKIGEAIMGTMENKPFRSSMYDKMKGRKAGGSVKMASGGKVSSASSRGDGIAQRGKTKGRIC